MIWPLKPCTLKQWITVYPKKFVQSLGHKSFAWKRSRGALGWIRWPQILKPFLYVGCILVDFSGRVAEAAIKSKLTLSKADKHYPDKEKAQQPIFVYIYILNLDMEWTVFWRLKARRKAKYGEKFSWSTKNI